LGTSKPKEPTMYDRRKQVLYYNMLTW